MLRWARPEQLAAAAAAVTAACRKLAEARTLLNGVLLEDVAVCGGSASIESHWSCARLPPDPAVHDAAALAMILQIAAQASARPRAQTRARGRVASSAGIRATDLVRADQRRDHCAQVCSARRLAYAGHAGPGPAVAGRRWCTFANLDPETVETAFAAGGLNTLYSLCIQLRAEYMYNTLYQNLLPLYSLSRST